MDRPWRCLVKMVVKMVVKTLEYGRKVIVDVGTRGMGYALV